MTKKIFLTSFIALGFACPSMAAPSNTGTFPTDGKMQADYTYTNAATSDNMAGVYENSVYANAQYTTNDYTVSAGTYLPADAEATATCTAGNFCPGLQSPVQYNETIAQGITACPSGYTNSVAGASANTECYRTCATSDVAHASSVSGQMYYNGTSGDGVNACSAEGCVNGWHVKPGLDLTTTIGTANAENSAIINNNGSFGEKNYTGDNPHGAMYYGLTDNSDYNAFVVDYGNKGMVHGHGRCSTQQGYRDTVNNNSSNFNNPTTVSSLTDETGVTGAANCYCNVDGYTPVGETLQRLSSSWVYIYHIGDASGCASNCAGYCALFLQDDINFRAAMFNSVQRTPSSCEANTITINWSDADQTDIDANNAGTVTYGGNINTPVKAKTKKGKVFTGWVFSTTAPGEQ